MFANNSTLFMPGPRLHSYAWLAAPWFVSASALAFFLKALSIKDGFKDAAWSHTSQWPAKHSGSVQGQMNKIFFKLLDRWMLFMSLCTKHDMFYSLHCAATVQAMMPRYGVQFQDAYRVRKNCKYCKIPVPESHLGPLPEVSKWRCGPCTLSHRQKFCLPWMHGCSRSICNSEKNRMLGT